MDDEFQVRNDERAHRFEIDLGKSIAIAEYRLAPGKIVFTHTKVPEQHEGKGVGSALIRAGLAYARDHNLQVVPTCPFFAAYMKKHEEVQDLLDPSSRKTLGLDEG